jgi:hypothetical protein
MKRIVVCDTGPLLHLSEAGAVHLLAEMGNASWKCYSPPLTDCLTILLLPHFLLSSYGDTVSDMCPNSFLTHSRTGVYFIQYFEYR